MYQTGPVRCFHQSIFRGLLPKRMHARPAQSHGKSLLFCSIVSCNPTPHLQDDELRRCAYRLKEMGKRLDYAQQYAEKHADVSMLVEVKELQQKIQGYRNRINDLVEPFSSMKL